MLKGMRATLIVIDDIHSPSIEELIDEGVVLTTALNNLDKVAKHTESFNFSSFPQGKQKAQWKSEVNRTGRGKRK